MSGRLGATSRIEKKNVRPEGALVSRYYAGKAPEYAPDGDSGDELVVGRKQRAQPEVKAEQNHRETHSSREVKMDDEVKKSKVEGEPVRRRRRQIYQGEIVVAQKEEVESRTGIHQEIVKDKEEVDEDIEVEEPKVSVQPVVEKEQEKRPPAEESSEDSSEESDDEPMLFRPVFVAKKDRETVIDEEKQREIEENERLERERTDQLKRDEAVRLLAEQVKKDVVGDVEEEIDFNGIDDTDDLDPEAEYMAWKLRHLKRIKRDKEERDAFILEQEEMERRREMTDEQRFEDELADGRDRFKRDKGQMRFLQKYYHKGAFYQEQDIMARDYTAPTLEDKVSKDALPEVLQVKKFGMASRSKWTHLANEDTSRKDAGWSQSTDVTDKMLKRMGGLHDTSLEKPPAKKRK